MEKSSLFLRLVFGTALVLASVPAQAENAESVWRLFVADRNQPVMHVLDVESGEKLDSFDLESQAVLYAGQSGENIFAVQADGNVVTGFSSGIAREDHGDHADLEVAPPKPLGVEIKGEKPVHFVTHHGDIAIFYDGEGIARIIREADLPDGKIEPRLVRTVAPHHGVAVLSESMSWYPFLIRKTHRSCLWVSRYRTFPASRSANLPNAPACMAKRPPAAS